MRYFLIAIGNPEVGDEVKFADFLCENQFGFWHRIPGIWLVTAPERMDSSQFIDMIGELFGREGQLQVIVAETKPTAMAAIVPPSYQGWFEKHLDFVFGSEPESEATKP